MNKLGVASLVLLGFFSPVCLEGQSARHEHMGRASVDEKGTEGRAHIGVIATVISIEEGTDSPFGVYNNQKVLWERRENIDEKTQQKTITYNVTDL